MPITAGAERAWVLPEEPLPVRLMSTVWADPDGRHDDFRAPADLDDWLDAVGLDRAGARASAGEFAAARALRDAARQLASYVTQDTRNAAPPDVDQALSQVNAAAAALPAPCLLIRAGRLERGTATGHSPVTTALADIARQAIDLLGGPGAARLRACYAPGCVLYFVAAHPRRAWCSVGCGNRVRAARHYQRVRQQR
jgi:predicted RNA-binding Zn ribbon-like protein